MRAAAISAMLSCAVGCTDSLTYEGTYTVYQDSTTAVALPDGAPPCPEFDTGQMVFDFAFGSTPPSANAGLGHEAIVLDYELGGDPDFQLTLLEHWTIPGGGGDVYPIVRWRWSADGPGYAETVIADVSVDTPRTCTFDIVLAMRHEVRN